MYADRWIRFAALLVLAPFARAWAQNYPAKNITLIVPYPAGGGADLFARVIAQDMMGRQFERQIVVDNRGGATGNLGAELVAKATPDGYTLLYAAAALNSNRGSLPKAPISLAARPKNSLRIFSKRSSNGRTWRNGRESSLNSQQLQESEPITFTLVSFARMAWTKRP